MLNESQASGTSAATSFVNAQKSIATTAEEKEILWRAMQPTKKQAPNVEGRIQLRIYARGKYYPAWPVLRSLGHGGPL